LTSGKGKLAGVVDLVEALVDFKGVFAVGEVFTGSPVVGGSGCSAWSCVSKTRNRTISWKMERVGVRSIPAMVLTYRRFAEVPFLSVRVTGN